MKRSTKIILGIPAGFAVLFFIAIILAALLFPKDRVISLIEHQAAEALGMPVDVGDAGISFAGIPALSVRDITVGPPLWTSEPLATIKSVRVRVNLIKLLSHSIEITSIDIDQPRIAFTPPPADTTAVETAEEISTDEPGPPSLPVPVTMQSLRISNGSIALHLTDDGSIELTNIDQRLMLSLDRELTNLTSSGTLKVGDIVYSTALLPEPIQGLELAFSYDITGDLTDGSFTLTSGILRVNDLVSDITGSLTDWSDIAFALTTGNMEASELLELIPESLIPASDRISATGTFSLSLEGTLKQSTLDNALQFAGNLDIPGMRLAYDGAPAAIDNIAANITINEQRVDIGYLEVTTGASELAVNGMVDAYMTEPTFDVTVTGDINMDDLIAAIPTLAGKDFTGKMGIDLAMTGSTDLSALSPTGSLILNDFAFVLPEVLNHPAAVTGTVGISPDTITLDGISAQSGESDVRFDGSVAGYLNLLSNDPESPVKFSSTVSSTLIDIADLLVLDTEKETAIIMPWHLKEPIEAMPVPPSLTADTAIRLGTIRFGNLTAESATGDIALADSRLDLSGLAVKAYNGTLTGGLNADFSDIENPTYETSLELAGFESGTFLADLFDVERFMRGTLSTTITLAGAGLDSVAVLENLYGHGDMTFTDGEIDNWEFTRKLGEHLSFLDFDTLVFNTIANSFLIEDKRIITPDMHLTFGHGDIYLDGATGFDKSIDYHIRFVLDQKASQDAAKHLSTLADLLNTEINSIELDVSAKGTIGSPSFTLDTSRAEQQLTNAAKRKIQDKAEELIEEHLTDEDIIEQGKEMLDRLFR